MLHEHFFVFCLFSDARMKITRHEGLILNRNLKNTVQRVLRYLFISLSNAIVIADEFDLFSRIALVGNSIMFQREENRMTNLDTLTLQV